MTVTKSLVSIVLLTFALPALSKITPEWIRYSAISPNAKEVAFTYKGNIYKVDIEGGQAQQLTYHKAHDTRPVWSKDGKKIAFASTRYGNFDVFVMDSAGGKAKRLTYHSANEQPYSFSIDDNEIYFKAHRMDTKLNRAYPTSRLEELYSVSVNGGRVHQVLTTPAEDVQVSSDGEKLLYIDHKGTENEWRKHHKSSATRDIWEYDVNSGTHRQLTKFKGEDRNPVYSADGKHVFYLSEQNGTFNVHKMRLNRPSSSTQLTEFKVHPVRFLSSAQDTLTFTHHGHLYSMKEGQDPQKINVSIRTQDIVNSEEYVNVNGEISEFSISPDGKEIAFISNGDVFVSSADGSFTKQITHTPSREAHVSFSKNADFLIYAAQRDSKWDVYKTTKTKKDEPFFYAASLLKEESLLKNDKDNYQPKISPNGNKLAFVEDRRTIKVLDFETNESITVVGPDKTIHFRDGDQEFSWSPDSQWILYVYDKLLNNTDVALVSADGKQTEVVIPSGYYDQSPKWVANGEQILWFSNREGLKSYATSGRTEYDVYSLFLTQEGWDIFNMSENDFKLMQAIEEKLEETQPEEENKKEDEASSEEDSEVKPEELSIEWDGLDRRYARLTIHSSFLSDAVLGKKAEKLYYLSRFEDGYDLWETNLRTQETKKTISINANRGGELKWDHDYENLYFLSAGRLSKLDVAKGKKESIRINEQMLVDYDAIRKQTFNHVWLRTSKIFYEPTYHGIDWDMMGKEYGPKVEHTSNPYEFTELLAEMLGELNVSHSGAAYRGNGEGDQTAALGIFFDYGFSENGIKISEIIQDGPLDKAKFEVEPGMIITHIDGQLISKNMDWAKLLNKKAGKFTLLTINDPKSENELNINVKPISLRDQSRLLYQRFVKTNEAEVLATSKGRLGYVHIPGMSDAPYRDIFDDMLGRFFDKEGMVVDVRNNGGGDLVADLAMFFTGDKFLTYATEDRVVGGEPTSRYTKPVTTLFNEAMYSDGHCYASGFTDLKIGKSVGMPVPGTCSFAGWESLPNGGFWGVVPVSAKNKAGEWLENNQTNPDILIKNEYADIAKGKDEQLEVSVKTLLKELR